MIHLGGGRMPSQKDSDFGLFAQERLPETPEEKFEAFHRENPAVYEELIRLTRVLKRFAPALQKAKQRIFNESLLNVRITENALGIFFLR